MPNRSVDRDVSFISLLHFLDNGKLQDGFLVARTIHGLLRFNQGVQRQNSATTPREVNDHTAFSHDGKGADSKHEIQAVELAQIGIQV